jgi:hypothetical protein
MASTVIVVAKWCSRMNRNRCMHHCVLLLSRNQVNGCGPARYGSAQKPRGWGPTHTETKDEAKSSTDRFFARCRSIRKSNRVKKIVAFV